MNQSIVDEAKRLAIKNLDDLKLNRPYTLEKGLLVYFRGLNTDLETDFNRWADDNKSNSIKRYTEELTRKNETIKKIFIANFYAEHSATIYKTATQLFGRKDDAIYPVGNDAPRRIGWSEIIKDTNPKSSLQYNLKDWVDGLSLFEHWDEKEAVMLFNLKKAFLNREIPIAYLDDIKTNYRWIVKITVRFKGEAG